MSNGITAWSYSRFADYKQCPYRFKLKYIDRLATEGSPAMERGNAVHKMAEDYIKAGRKPELPEPFGALREQLEHCREHGAMAELPWGFTDKWEWNGRQDWFGREVWFRMKADVAVGYDDNTGLVADWKTGRKYSEHEDQAKLFGAATLKRFPEWTEVDVRFWYPDQPEDTNETDWQFSRREGELILKDWAKRVVPMFKDKRFAPTPNDKCCRCDFRKEKGGPCKF